MNVRLLLRSLAFGFATSACLLIGTGFGSAQSPLTYEHVRKRSTRRHVRSVGFLRYRSRGPRRRSLLLLRVIG